MARQDMLELWAYRHTSPHNAVSLNGKYTRADGQTFSVAEYLGQRDVYGLARIMDNLAANLRKQGWQGSLTLERGTFWRLENVDVGWTYANREFGDAAMAAMRDVPIVA